MPVRVIIDNRLRMHADDLPGEMLESLQDQFTHKNPTWSKLKSMGKHPPASEPKEYVMWHQGSEQMAGGFDPDEFSLPRGGMQKLRNAFDEYDLDYEVIDNRSMGAPHLLGSYVDGWQIGCDLFPPHKLVAWEHQVGMVEAANKYGQILIRAPTGCITGDAMIGINRGGKGGQVRLDHIVKMHNGGVSYNKRWDLDIKTRIRARMDDGTVRLVDLVDAYVSGKKPVYEVRFASGHGVTATLDHRFMTTDGWHPLGKLSIGDEVYVEESRRPKKRTASKKNWYKLRTARYHPFVARKGVKSSKGGYTVALHRLVAESRLNNIPLETFIQRCNDKWDHLEGLTFLDPKEWAVHHIDEVPHNNDADNLAVLTHAQHRKLRKDLSLANIAVRTVPSKVVAIAHVGEQETYDLALEAPHNFLANGVTVHNSGKTSAIIKHIAERQAPALIIMWDAGLLTETWQPRIEAELGIPVKEQGLIRGSTFRLRSITLAMQQTLARWGEEKWERLFFENKNNGLTQCVFHSVYADEVQRYAARTFVDFVDRFDCHDRIGVTADEKRKDRKTFIIYDMFGPVRHEVSKKELVRKRIIHDVECYVVPTNFRADWYVQLKEDDLFDPMIHTRQLLDEMAVDKERNELAVHLIEQCVQAGLPTLSFTQWVDHARRIDAALTGKGIASGLALGGKEWEQVFKETLQQLRDGQLQVGCGTFGKLGVGHDIPAVAAGLAVTPIHNNKGFLGQVKGRICRTTAGKENARIIVMWDRMVYGDGPLHNLRAWNEVCNVWNEWDKRWQDVSDYLKEIKNGRAGTTTTAANEEGLFVNKNAGGNHPKRRRSGR